MNNWASKFFKTVLGNNKTKTIKDSFMGHNI